ERAASCFALTLGPEQRAQLDQALQERVLSALGGLHAACAGSVDLVRSLALPLVNEAAAHLSGLLPVTDVSQVEIESATANQSDVATQIHECLARATPLVTGKDAAQQASFLLVPASDPGKLYGEEAQRTVPEMAIVRVPGQAHLMFCREQGYLSAEELQHLLR